MTDEQLGAVIETWERIDKVLLAIIEFYAVLATAGKPLSLEQAARLTVKLSTARQLLGLQLYTMRILARSETPAQVM